ncbi:MAG: HhH-GPD-type base excision DNA repair protein [Dermatophilaceae bacterium]
MHLAITDAANNLLERDPLALLLGMMLDQQVTMEKAFTSPADLAARMGVDRLDATAIASAEPAQMEAWFRTPPALHRYPTSMAQRAQALCGLLVEKYHGDAATVWDTDDAAQLLRRLKGLPGFGEQKARIFVALLGKQRGITPPGWEKAAGDYGQPGFRSVADIVDADSLARVRAHKQAMKAAAKVAAATKNATG